jgi:N-acetylglucosamine repressor
MIDTQLCTSARSTSSQQLIKDQNTMLLFNLVRKMPPISRAELARRSGLSPATVSILIEELIANQWIQETDSVAPSPERGRRPILLEVNASRGFVATVEILSRGYICSIYDICLHKIASVRSRDTASSSRQIADTLLGLARSKRITNHRLLGIHILYPGLFDTESGELGFSAVIREDEMVQTDLVAHLRRRLPQAHVMISNNAAMVAYSEFIAESLDAAAPLLAMTIYEGINAGVVLGGKECMPVEAGHTIIQRNGPLCKCNNRGCLEAFCSTPALFRSINQRTSLGLEFQDDYGADCNHEAMAKVAAAFQAGDEAVEAVIKDYVYALSCGIISIVNLFAIRSVRIGGAVRALGEPFAEMLRHTLKQEFHIITNARSLTVELFDDDYESSRHAAVMLILERIFQNA